ncbi:hypothetical protein OAD74_05490 [Alphaproteobacteria bacterium]|nr:hypothetical protein [Alphaproteobacteria bacterium]
MQNRENGTKGENRLAVRTKQVHTMLSLSGMVQIFKSSCLAFQAFRRAKVEILKFIIRNRCENEHNIKCMDRGGDGCATKEA